jgi:hypothetical protein
MFFLDIRGLSMFFFYFDFQRSDPFPSIHTKQKEKHDKKMSESVSDWDWISKRVGF